MRFRANVKAVLRTLSVLVAPCLGIEMRSEIGCVDGLAICVLPLRNVKRHVVDQRVSVASLARTSILKRRPDARTY